MSREIKFRAFDKAAKILIVAFCPCWADNYPGVFEIMQFTGLKDAIGKEIYEGDIVQFDQTIMTVKWSKQRAQFFLWQEGWEEYHEIGLECVVIGNIYETPELLKASATPQS